MASPVWLSDHAIARYRDRLKPQLSHTQAADHLRAQLPSLVWQDLSPSWLAQTPSSLGAVAYLVSPGLFALPLRHHRHKRGLVAPTCLTPQLQRPDHQWVLADDLVAMRNLLRLSGQHVVNPWRKMKKFGSLGAARSDLLHQACLGDLLDPPVNCKKSLAYLWLPGGLVLFLNQRPGGLRACGFVSHREKIAPNPKILEELGHIASIS